MLWTEPIKKYISNKQEKKLMRKKKLGRELFNFVYMYVSW